MFGLTELTVLSDESYSLAIIPTIVLPFAVVGIVLTSIATWIAAIFGYKLKTEGPRRLLEVILKPKVIVISLLLNGLIYGLFWSYKKMGNSSWPVAVVELRNRNVSRSELTYTPNDSLVAPSSRPTEKIKVKDIEVIWSKKITGGVFSGIAQAGSSLFMGTSKGLVYELDRESGEEVRHFVFGQPIMVKPLIFNGRIYFGEGVHDTFNAKFMSMDLKSGKYAGSISTKGHIERAATFAKLGQQAYMLIAAGRDGIIALDPVTFKVLWHKRIGHVDGTAYVDKDRVFIGTALEAGDKQSWTKIFSLDLETGNIINEKEVGASAFGESFVWKENICFNLGDVYRSTNYGQIACYNKNSFEEVTSVNVAGALIANAIVQGDDVVVGDFLGGIYKINLATSRIVARAKIPIYDHNYAPIVVTGADEFVIPGKEGLYFFTLSTLQPTLIWSPKIEGWKGAYDNIHIKNEKWYWADKQGHVFSLKPLR